MSWRDRQPDPQYHERWSQAAREADLQWDNNRRRRRSPVPVWEHQEHIRSNDRNPRNQDDRFDRPDRENQRERMDRDRYDRDRTARDRFDRYDRNRSVDRIRTDDRSRSNDRNVRSERDSRDRERDREDRFDRRNQERDDRFSRDRDNRREMDRDRSSQRYDTLDEDNIPKAPSPPKLTEHEKAEMRSVAELNRDGMSGGPPGEASVPSTGDWYCVCGALNFKRRSTCYRRGCTFLRTDGTVFNGDQDTATEEKSGITKRLLFRRLDTLTTEERILEVLKKRVPQIVDTITGITIGKDSLTGTSRGLAYISFNSLSESTAAHTALLKLSPRLRIDSNRDILVTYCHDLPKHTNTPVTQNTDYTAYYMQAGIEFGSSLLPLSEADRINAAAAVAQSAISAAQARTMWMPAAAPTFISSNQIMVAAVEPPDGKGLQKYSAPDVRTFMYDETSGYYYDASTGLYYDGTTQYFYNNKLNAYLYWDAASSTYYVATQTQQNSEQPKLPSPPEATVQNTIVKEPAAAELPQEEKKKDKEKEDKVKVAKKIAKDMARWAKTLNQKKENARNGLVMEQILDTSASKGSADIGFSVLGASGPAFPPIVREISPIPPAEDFLIKRIEEVPPEESDEGIIDWSKLTCLLCKRRFPSSDVLTKHKNMSDLHKQNLAEFRSSEAQQQMNGYRDRAAERRMKYGDADEPIKKIYQQPPPAVQAVQAATSVVDTIGGKMLQRMGWSEGKGLGKEEQGRTAPVEAEKRVAGAGLGQKRGIYTAAPGETYRDTVKKLMIARYKDLVGDEE